MTIGRATPHRRIAAILVPLALLLAVGCASPESAAPVAAPPVTATPTPTPTPTSTPTPAPQTPESVWAGTTCGELLDPSAMAVPVAELTADEQAVSTAAVVFIQAGGMTCAWTTPDGRSGILLTVLAGEDPGPDPLEYRDDGTPARATGTVAVGCGWDGVTFRPTQCAMSIVSSEKWAYVYLWSDDYGREEDLFGWAGAIEAELVAGLASAPEPEPWQPPQGAWDVEDCAGLDSSNVLAAHFGTDLTVRPPDHPLADTPHEEIAFERAGFLGCFVASTHEGARSLAVTILPGGGWARDRLLEGASASEEVTVAGAEHADFRCPSDGRPCTLDVFASGSWLRLSSFEDRLDRDTLAALAEALLPGLDATMG